MDSFSFSLIVWEADRCSRPVPRPNNERCQIADIELTVSTIELAISLRVAKISGIAEIGKVSIAKSPTQNQRMVIHTFHPLQGWKMGKKPMEGESGRNANMKERRERNGKEG